LRPSSTEGVLRLDGLPQYALIGFDPSDGWLIELRKFSSLPN
jgi:hypothetical protein